MYLIFNGGNGTNSTGTRSGGGTSSTGTKGGGK